MILLFGLSEIASAQGLPTARQRGNVDFIEIVLVKYKNGMSGTAAMHIMKYFNPAAVAAEAPQPFILHFQTGEWDAGFYWNRGKSMANFDWSVTEGGEKFWIALAEQNGGAENARKLMADYEAMISHTAEVISHHHIPPE